MKKLIGTIILIMMLTGCSSVKKSADNKATQSANNAAVENASTGNNKQAQSESESQEGKQADSDEGSSLLDSIDTTKSQFQKGYYDYAGSINNNLPIQMSIYQQGTDIVGTYFYETQRKEINLKGKAGEKNIVLYEYDETGKNTGIFQGTMNTVDKIDGTWKTPYGKSSFPFSITLKSIIPGAEYGKRYAMVLKNENDQDVEDFASKIQGYVVNGDKEQLAEQMVYPISVKINGKITKMQNKDEFIRNYDLIFYPKYKQVISNAFTKYLFVNWQGIMLGEGMNNIWINEMAPDGSNSRLMIIAINN